MDLNFRLGDHSFLRDRMEMDFSSTDDDLRDAMAWRHGTRHSVACVAWRGMACHTMPYPCHRLHHHNPRFEIAQNKHHLTVSSFSPRLTSSHHASAHSVIWDFPGDSP